MDALARGEVYRGYLGETSTSRIQVTGEGGATFVAEVYDCINVTRDPDLKESLYSGELLEVRDPGADESIRIARPLRFHNEELRLFALVIPDELRHREFQLRADLLSDLSEEEESLPAYIRDFEVVFGVEALQQLEESRQAGEDGDFAAPSEKTQVTELPEPGDRSGDLADEWSELEREREEIERERSQLDEVRNRIDRERTRLDETEEELSDEREALEKLRSELEEERQSLEAMRLNLEQKELKAEQGAPESNAEESTQVVTEDQFVEVSEVHEEGPVEVEGGELSADSDDRPEVTEIETAGTDDVPAEFDENETDAYVTIVDGEVLAVSELDDERLDELTGDNPAFFVQYHEIDDYPVIGLSLASLDDDEQPVVSIGWPLDVADSDDEMIIHRLSEATDLRVALYGEDGSLVEAFEIRAPLGPNVDWARKRAEQRLESGDIGDFDSAAAEYTSDDFERIGSMRHNFTRNRFEELDTPSQVKLAAGIVGYWSSDEQFEYLVANRSFPLDAFRDIQRRVVEAAVDTGIFLEKPLRELAIDEDLADGESQLVERLITSFAEVGVQLRENDLEPYDEWENWNALINLAEDIGVTPDPEVLELAEASLKRARDQQETEEALGPDTGEDDPTVVSGTFDDLVVAKRSEATGVTYFLPDEAVLDTFDDLASMSREDLELLLEDAEGRLEAAQMLIERFDGGAVATVLEASEQMSAPEVASLARFIETKADGLEADLVKAVEDEVGPSATFVAARALASEKSQSAIPMLLEALRDDSRRGNKEAMARALSQYGEKIVPALSRAVKKEGVDEMLVLLLAELEQAHDGILDELLDDRNEAVQEAAKKARERL